MSGGRSATKFCLAAAIDPRVQPAATRMAEARKELSRVLEAATAKGAS